MWNVYHRPLRIGLIFLTFFSLLSSACRLFFPEPVDEINATLTALAVQQNSASPGSITPSITPSLAAYPSATLLLASPSPRVNTPSPDSKQEQLTATQLREMLISRINSPEWTELGLTPARSELWQAFSAETIELSQPELQTLQRFLERWSILDELLADPLPENSQPALRVTEYSHSEGTSTPVIYIIDKRPSQLSGEQQLFLIAHNPAGEPQALLMAPQIQELAQRPSPDGEYVDYFDDKDNLLLRSDARQLDDEITHEKALLDMLQENDVDSLYAKYNLYPRFFFNIPDIPSSFYLVEKLTLNQIKLLIATFGEFNRPYFVGLKEFTFTPSDNVPFLISREDHPFAAALALPMGGDPPRGIILLYSRNIFANKYETMGSIAHEVVHIWQGVPPGCDKPQARLQREIGNGTIPPDLRTWEAAEIIQQSSQSHQLGAYHMSLWVAMHYNLNDYIRFYRSIITTGTVNGQPIINCGNQ